MGETEHGKRLQDLRRLIASIFAALTEFDLSVAREDYARQVIRGLAQRHRNRENEHSVAIAVEAGDRVIDCLKWRPGA